MRKNYDIMVIGNSIGGLISGALLAKKGFQVLVVNQEQFPWDLNFEGHFIEREPLQGHGFKRYLFEKIFEELGIRSHEQKLFERDQPFYQIILPESRIDIVQNRNLLFKEYLREFPEHINSIKSFFSLLNHFDSEHSAQNTDSLQKIKKILPKSLSLNRKKIKILDIFSQLRLPITFQKSILAQCSLVSNNYCDNPFMDQVAHMLSPCNRKDYFFFGKSRDLAQIFYDRILEAGGSIRNDAVIENFQSARGKVQSARLSSFEGVVHSKFYIGNYNLRQLYKLFDPKKIPLSTKRKLAKCKPRFTQHSFYLGLEKEVLPVKMGNHLALIWDENKPLADDNLIFVHILPSDNHRTHCIAKISFLLPYLENSDESPENFLQVAEEVKMRVFEHVHWLIPFLEPNIIFSYPSRNKRSKKSYIPTKIPLSREIYPIKDRKNGISVLFKNKTQFANLFYTGPEIHPFHGFEGEILSSIQTAEMILKEAKS